MRLLRHFVNLKTKIFRTVRIYNICLVGVKVDSLENRDFEHPRFMYITLSIFAV